MSLTSRFCDFAISPLPVPASWYAIPLRLILGFGFMQHGYAKLARGPEDFISVLHAIGVPMPFLAGWATIVVELIGGAMIFAGALVPLATIPMIFVLLMGSARSSSNRLTLQGLILASPVMKPTFSTPRGLSPYALAVLGHFLLTSFYVDAGLAPAPTDLLHWK